MGVMERFEKAAAGRIREFLSFQLGGEEYGIDILRVQEIRGCETVTRIASAPAYLKGVVNLRGTIVPVIDLRAQLALGDVREDAFNVVIVLNAGRRLVGAVVDSVSDVLAFGDDQIRPALEADLRLDAGYVMGLGTVGLDLGGRTLILLDIDRLVAAAPWPLPAGAAA